MHFDLRQASLRSQILDTDTLLRDVDARRAPLFRFPYGARNAEGMRILGEAKLRSVMWNIDSLDWADPVPESIVQRVIDQVHKEQRGILLFHDIHERTVKALPQILDRLSAEGYQFAAWNGRDFSVTLPALAAGQRILLTYLAEVIVSAQPGNALNRATATDNRGATSNVSEATVSIKRDQLGDRMTIIGRITDGGVGIGCRTSIPWERERHLH